MSVRHNQVKQLKHTVDILSRLIAPAVLYSAYASIMWVVSKIWYITY